MKSQAKKSRTGNLSSVETPPIVGATIVFSHDQIKALGAAIARHIAPASADASPDEAIGPALTKRQFCEKVGIGATKFFQLIKDKKLRPVYIGKRTLRIPPEEVARYMREGATRIDKAA